MSKEQTKKKETQRIADGILRKMHNPVVKAEDGEESRVIEFYISDSTNDRHHDVIPITAWKLDNYEKNGIVAYMHETGPGWLTDKSDPDSIIGKGSVYIEGDKLVGKVEFEPASINPLAEKVYQKVKFGTLKATSVGFIPHKGHWGVESDGEDTGTYYYDLVELTEFSIVNIPANPNALIQTSQMIHLLQNPIREVIRGSLHLWHKPISIFLNYLQQTTNHEEK